MNAGNSVNLARSDVSEKLFSLRDENNELKRQMAGENEKTRQSIH
jgi:hypothetical protein